MWTGYLFKISVEDIFLGKWGKTKHEQGIRGYQIFKVIFMT